MNSPDMHKVRKSATLWYKYIKNWTSVTGWSSAPSAFTTALPVLPMHSSDGSWVVTATNQNETEYRMKSN